MKREFLNGRIVVYNADCLDVMREIGDKEIDLVLTDPPYGLNKRMKGGTWGTDLRMEEWDFLMSEITQKEVFRISKNQIIWGGNYYSMPASRCWLIWDKPELNTLADFEMAWTSFDKLAKKIRLNRNETCETRFHPTQKPVALMSWCLLNNSKENDLIFDGFLGSGTTAISCIRTNRRLIGCELDPIYFKKMCERIETELRQESLFAYCPPKSSELTNELLTNN